MARAVARWGSASTELRHLVIHPNQLFRSAYLLLVNDCNMGKVKKISHCQPITRNRMIAAEFTDGHYHCSRSLAKKLYCQYLPGVRVQHLSASEQRFMTTQLPTSPHTGTEDDIKKLRLRQNVFMSSGHKAFKRYISSARPERKKAKINAGINSFILLN